MSGNKTAWHAVIRGTDVRFELEEADDVGFKAVADYRAVLPLARYDTMNRADRAAELQAMAQALVATGKLRIIGTPPSAGGPFQTVHDSMCHLTA